MNNLKKIIKLLNEKIDNLITTLTPVTKKEKTVKTEIVKEPKAKLLLAFPQILK